MHLKIFDPCKYEVDYRTFRCIRKHVGVACTWNYEMRTLFHNNQTVPHAYEGGISELRRAITLHPIKRPSIMRRMHAHNRALRLTALRSRRVALIGDLPMTKTPSLTRHIANTTRDLRHWDFISSNSILFCTGQVNCPRHTVDLSIRTAIGDVVTQVGFHWATFTCLAIIGRCQEAYLLISYVSLLC